MRVLAIDTSSREGSVALSVEEGRGGVSRLEKSSSHLVELGRTVSSLLATAGVGIEDIDRVAVVIGPGSFTGLRVGLAYVKGIYAARKIEIVAMTSLELLALGAVGEGLPVSAMIDARRDEVYAAHYDPVEGSPSVLAEKIAPRVIAPGEHLSSLPRAATVFAGSGALRYRMEIDRSFGPLARFAGEGGHEPDTRLLCEIAKGLVPLDPGQVATLEPLYVRPSDIKLQPLRGVRAYDRG